MTVEELQTKRDEILQTLGLYRVTHGDKSVEYSKQAEALAVVDAEIARATAQTSGGSRFRTSFVTFTSD